MTKDTNIFHDSFLVLESIKLKVNAIKKVQFKNWT